MIKTIGIITPGGDAPGINAAIRAIVRVSIFKGLKVFGIYRGFKGLINGEIEELGGRSVSGIINRGGTVLRTLRCPEFLKRSCRGIAAEKLQARKIDALIIIGGNGSVRAAKEFLEDWKGAIMVIPATIDNDIPGTDTTIGFDTAVNTAVEAIDKIRDTATSHERVFVVEVMGRESGQLAAYVALTSGAEIVLIPEVRHPHSLVCKELKIAKERGKRSFIIVVAEGYGRGEDVANFIRKNLKLDVRVTVLGHIQRGGIPTALSREIATKLGAAAVELLVKGVKNKVVGMVSGKPKAIDIKAVLAMKRPLDWRSYKLTEMLAT